MKKINEGIIFSVALLALSVPLFTSAYEATPVALTRQATFITEKQMQLNGLVDPSELPDTFEWFEWGIVGNEAVYETDHEHLFGANQMTLTSATIVGLAPDTQYFYRQIAENNRGRNVGYTGYVTTRSLSKATEPAPLVSTYDATFIKVDSATVRGYLSPHGDGNTKAWFEWGTTTAVSNQTQEQFTSGDSVFVEARLQNLGPGTLYYFRAVAENNKGRSYGALRVFKTTGAPSVTTEAPRDESLPSSNIVGGTVPRVRTTDGKAPTLGVGQNDLPEARNRPGAFFGMISGGSGVKKNADAVPSYNVATKTQVASVAASEFLVGSEMQIGKKDVEVAVGKIGPKDVIAHTPLEYRIAYAYRPSTPATDAKLKVTLKEQVIYIGDNTNNELLLEPGVGPERTYVLPLGDIKSGSTRTISIMGMTTGDAKDFPDAVVKFYYTDKDGTHVVGAGNGTPSGDARAVEHSASIANVGSRILPGSFLGWIAYIAVVVGFIFGVRKARSYFVKKRELLVPSFLPDAEKITPQKI